VKSNVKVTYGDLLDAVQALDLVESMVGLDTRTMVAIGRTARSVRSALKEYRALHDLRLRGFAEEVEMGGQVRVRVPEDNKKKLFDWRQAERELKATEVEIVVWPIAPEDLKNATLKSYDAIHDALRQATMASVKIDEGHPAKEGLNKALGVLEDEIAGLRDEQVSLAVLVDVLWFLFSTG
jgi:hypothetical protein